MRNLETKTPLYHELYTFVCSVIAIRKRLLKNDVSRRNKMLMWKTVTALENLITVNRYDNDRNMASFFIRHSAEIENLIPGQGSKSHNKFISQFRELKTRAMEKYLASRFKPQATSLVIS